MSDIKELYETITQQASPKPDALERQRRRQMRRTVDRKLGAFAVVAAIAVAAVALIVGNWERQGATTPATGMTAEEIATGFVEAYGAFDADRAISYFAEDVDLSGWGGSVEGLQQTVALFRAIGYEQTLDSCQETSNSAVGTGVHCTFDYQNLRSDELGVGPFSGGSFDITVRDGTIVRVSGRLAIGKFSPQVWEPFAAWVSKAYPKDVAVMYTDGTLSDWRLTEQSIRLWERHTKEYVKVVAGRTGGQ